MDMRCWKKVLLQWITECGFMDRSYFNIEQSDIDTFYQNFSLQHQKTSPEKYKHVGDFLKEFYPSFEINLDDENCLSSADYMYVYSLLLHFCCVKQPQTMFHEICQRLSDHDQQCIAAFFKELLDTEPITKEVVRHAIAEIGNNQCTPPRLNESFSSNITSLSVGGLNSSSFLRCESPIKTPKRCAGPQRISPSTPKSYLLEERTKELYNLRAQLETERYEKGLLEVQIKQNEDKIQKFNYDHKRLVQQIQDLKNDILVNTSDCSTNHDDKENQIQKRLLKELSQREQEKMKLSDTIQTLREEKSLVEKKCNYAEKQIIICMNRIKELDFKVDELKEELEKQNSHIKFLNERKLELEQFIADTRSSIDNPELNESVDCMDNSFLRNSSNTVSSNSISSPENLGVSVIDVQLREKEHENQLLKEELQNIKREHKRLAKHLTKLTEEFDLPLDSSSPVTSKDSKEDIAVVNGEADEEDSQDDKISYEEQFNIFDSCMEKINKFQKSEKIRIKQLEQKTYNLQEGNNDLTKKLGKLKVQVEEFEEKLVSKEKLNKELEKCKEEIEMSFEKSKTELQNVQIQKEKLYKTVQSLEQDNKALNGNIQELKTKLELQQNECVELLAKNAEHEKCEESLQNQLKNIKKEFSDKTLQWEDELKKLGEKIGKQSEEIETYKKSETTIKWNYEQIVVQNEELKKESRQANAHLSVIRNELLEKEKQMDSLGTEIAELKSKNQYLEQNLNGLVQEQKEEKLINENMQITLDEELRKLKEQLSETTLLVESKQHDCDLKQQQLKDIKTKIAVVQKLFGESSEKEDIFQNIEELEIKVYSLLNNNEELNKKMFKLNEEQLESSNITQELKLELHGKTKSIELLEEKLSSLKRDNDELKKKIQNLTQELQVESENCAITKETLLKIKKLNEESEMKFDKLKQEQVTAIKKLNKDMEEKERELQERLKEGALEYEASLERIRVEMKLEKEHYNNKEMEMILILAGHNDTKKRLNEAQEEILKLQADNNQLQKSHERLENKVVECSAENDKLRNEIEMFKQEVTQNALRLLEADKALAEFMDLIKQQDSVNNEVETLQTALEEKNKIVSELEFKLKQQSQYETQLNQLKCQLEEQTDLVTSVREQLEKLDKDKERLTIEIEEKSQQILKVQQDKLLLLNSLEKSTDQLKLAVEEKQQQNVALEKKLQELKEKFESITLQNTKLQGDLVEREAELRLCMDEQQQEKEDFQQKFSQLMQKLAEKTEELETIDMALMEVVAIVENNFNFAQELLNKNEVENIFKYNEMENESNIQKLRQQLNLLLRKQQQLNEQLNKICNEKEEALHSVTFLNDRNNELETKLKHEEKNLREMKEQLEKEELVIEKRIMQEVKRLEEDLLNLEKVNERLANENVKIQVTLGNAEQALEDSKKKLACSEEENFHLKEQVRSKFVMVEKLQQEEKRLEQALKEKHQQCEKNIGKSKHFEMQLKEKTLKLQNLEKECQELKEKANRNQQKLSYYQQSQQNQQTELKKLEEKLDILQTSNESMELEVNSKNVELLSLKNRNNELLQQYENLEQQLDLTSKKLDEMVANKLSAETKCEQLQSEVKQLKRDLELNNSQQQTQQDDYNRLTQENESLKKDKQHLRDEINENKLTLQCSNDNVTQLIQQISSIRLEKEAAIGENILLRKQLEEIGKNQTTSETKMKCIIEKSQNFERKLLTAENELKALNINLEKSESTSEKLNSENKKLRDSQEIATKRIEKLALKLGDSQARSAKLERDNEKLNRTLEAHTTTVEALQKEKDLLQFEAKALKERLSRAERGHEQLTAKVQNLEHFNANLQKIKEKLEASEIDGKTKLIKLEKLRESTEEKLRKLNNALNNTENTNVKLNLEIGSLNSQLQEMKLVHKQEQTQQIEELNHKLEQTQELMHNFEEINEKLKIELNSLKEENSSLNDQLSKALLSLKITSQKCEKLTAELEQIRAEMLIIRQEKSQMEFQHETSIQKLSQFESQNTKLTHEHKNLVKSHEQRIAHLEEELAAKTKEVVDLQKEIENLKENSESHASMMEQNSTTNLSEIEHLRTKLSLAEEIRQKEQQIISQLRLDNQILHTKYQESKQRALEAAKASEERIKENRLELEGKLEKMKNKMKTLYTEEITKMKTKQDREIAILKSEMEVLKAQNTKYEEHTRKLSNQIVRLNDNILQHQKENTILSTKLKHTMEQFYNNERAKRHSSIHVSTISTSTAPVTGPNIGTNLAMEDEEGEIFNNTYLTDLKTGQMSELMSRDVCVEELKYRNSLLPPHLRSTYAAQFDHEFPEDDLKDNPHILDDSMSALLSTTAGGTRKKCTGVTHYKRPGPPTPSKNGGRLSFSGISEPAREILKESYDTNATSSKTPARFNFFSSRFSMGPSKDEILVKKESGESSLRKDIQKQKIKRRAHKLLSAVGCTSTPRKSKVHYDQRRLLDQLITSSPSPSSLALDNKVVEVERKITPPEVSIIETPLTALNSHEIPKVEAQRSNSKRLVAIASGLRRNHHNSAMFGRRLSRRIREICTPTSGETTSSAMSSTPMVNNDKRRTVISSVTTSGGVNKSTLLQRRWRKRPKRVKGASRPSLCLRGNIFVKYRTPHKRVLHDINRYKSRKQRIEQFNRGRNIEQESEEGLDNTLGRSRTLKNVTYNLKNNKSATMKQNKMLSETTVVIEKCNVKDEKIPEDTFTFGEEQFENQNTTEFDYMENCETDEECSYNVDDEGDDINSKEDDNDFTIKKESSKQKLISSQDLENFDRFIANIKVDSKKDKHLYNYSSQGSSKHFEKLLLETESSAPFETNDMIFNIRKSSRSSRSRNFYRSSYSCSNHNHSSRSSHIHPHGKHDPTAISTATPHRSPINPTCQFSRTIYGGAVIYNHRLPNINTTFVRKSSIYIKNRHKSLGHHSLESSSCNDVILITNQTITFVDIMHMWSQMDSSTRLIVSFAILASFITLLSLFISFCSRR